MAAKEKQAKEQLRAVIVDDEPWARKVLRHLLAAHQQVTVVGEAGTIVSAAEIIVKERPDIVFLDIAMPSGSGFDLLPNIDPEIKIVFTTAFDSYAIRAFEVNAFDYLVKPIRPERLDLTIQRILAETAPGDNDSKKLEYDDMIFLRGSDRPRFVRVDTMKCITADGDYSELVLADNKKILVLKSLKKWESQLPEKHFIRIHRGTIINIDYVEQLKAWFQSSFKVYLKDMPEPLEISRRYSARLRERFPQ
jgi:two-component system LytT family response regulator